MNISLETPIDLSLSLEISTNTKLEILHEKLYGSPATSFLYVLILILNHVIGTLLLGGIIAYEWYGGDPQKRNIINRLQSLGLVNLIMSSTILGFVRVVREIVGLIDFNFMFWTECLFCMCVCNTILFFTEMSVFQFLYIVVWKRVKGLVDEFWGAFLIGTTYAVSFWVVLIDHISQRMITTNLLVHTANLKESIEEIRYWRSLTKILILEHYDPLCYTEKLISEFLIFIHRQKESDVSILQIVGIISLTIHLISAIQIAYQKMKYQKEDNRSYIIHLSPKPGSNNTASNENDVLNHSFSTNTTRYNPILYELGNIIYFVIILSVYFVLLIVQHFHTNILSDYAINFLSGIMIKFIFPLIFYVQNPKSRRFILSCCVSRWIYVVLFVLYCRVKFVLVTD